MTTTVQVQLDLPVELAQELARMGLLEPDALRAVLRKALRACRLARLAEARCKIAAAGIAPLTMEEINTEVKADRAERYAAGS